MADWYKKCLRRNLIDMHIEDWNEEFLSRFDSGTYFANLKKANINAPMIYMQSHVGYCYWPTKTGRMHKAFEGRETMLRKLFDLCHEAGMSVIAYYSLIFNNWAYEMHPEWRMRDIEKKYSRDQGNRYGVCCPNNEGYRYFVAAQIKEFCDFFSFEGVYFDMAFWPMVCYCDSCRQRWDREVGGTMPEVIDWNEPRWARLQKKRQEWMGNFAQFATDTLKKHKPGCSVAHQYGPANYAWTFGVNENIAMASDYAAGDLYGGFEQQSFACKLYYNLTSNQPFEYQTSRCYPDLFDHTTIKPIEMLELGALLTYAHHGACMFIDAIDPKGTIDGRVYESIGKVFTMTEKYEPYLEGELVGDVGIYYNLNGKMDNEQKGIPLPANGEDIKKLPHIRAVYGAASILRGRHIPYSVVNNWRLELFEKLKVLVLPNVLFMEAREIQAVKEFVKNGGALYLSGYSDPGLLEELLGAKYEGVTDETITYMAPTEAGAGLMDDFTREYPMAIFSRQVRLSGVDKIKFMATTVLPYTIPPIPLIPGVITQPAVEGEHSNDNAAYRFASIHSNPPGIHTDYPAVIRCKYGKGDVIWASAPIEAASRPQHNELFYSIIRELGGAFSFSSNAPEEIELIMFRVPEKRRILISAMTIQERFKPIAMQNFDIKIKIEHKPVTVFLLPYEIEVPYQFFEGEIVIQIEKLELFQMFSINY